MKRRIKKLIEKGSNPKALASTLRNRAQATLNLGRNGMRRDQLFPPPAPLPLPAGVSEAQLKGWLSQVRVSDAPPAEMAAYVGVDFRRFVYTWGLARDLKGEALELGANPYFTTFLLREWTQLSLRLANFFGEGQPKQLTQDVHYRDFQTGKERVAPLTCDHFNIENDRFPYEDARFDVVFFCEILEHLLMDPMRVLGEIKRVLKPGGSLILTTPNVNRLENVAKMIAGGNVHDHYSGYGPYGRHNREYNKHELFHLLKHLGFEVETLTSSDVHGDASEGMAPLGRLEPLIRFRRDDLGQYLFCRAKNAGPANPKKPSWLYRSYPAGELT